ncbi:hypothetical protein FACS189499_10030 [Clostridia bacterium]|nr:hypothetical protein FACS189499_10030 [Clostridia bacterium]
MSEQNDVITIEDLPIIGIDDRPVSLEAAKAMAKSLLERKEHKSARPKNESELLRETA